MDKLFADVSSLYRLGQAGGASMGKKDLGPLPATAKLLLAALALTWVGIGAYVLLARLRKKKM